MERYKERVAANNKRLEAENNKKGWGESVADGFLDVGLGVTEGGMKLGSFAGKPGEIVGGVLAAPVGIVGGVGKALWKGIKFW